MKITNPLVSIIIPSYNVELYLADACESLLNQTYINWEAVIVDDGSTDKTAIISNFYVEKDNRFKYIYQINKGLSAARKTGIDHSTGIFIQLLDADDILLPNRLSEMVHASIELEDNVILYSSYLIGLNNNVKDKFAYPNKPVTIGKDIIFNDFYEGFSNEFLFIPACPFFRKFCFDKIEYDETLRSVEDFDLYLNLLSYNFVFRYFNSSNVIYRDNPQGLSKNMTFIYQNIFFVLNKWKITTSFSKRNYLKICARYYSIVLYNYYFNRNTELVKPINGLNVKFYSMSYLNFIYRIINVYYSAIKKKIWPTK